MADGGEERILPETELEPEAKNRELLRAVKLRGGLFLYFASQLAPVYKGELDSHRRGEVICRN